jgi:hypothetical protein
MDRRLALVAALAALAALPACSAAPDDDTGSDESEVVWEPISTLLGNPPNFAQLGNGNTMTVVSRDEGRGSKAGALVELFYPKYAADNLWDSYVGIRSKGQKLRWAHQLDLRAQRIIDDTGIVQSDFSASAFTMRIEDVMRPANDAHVRHVIVTNTSKETIENAEIAFYAYYTLKNLPEGDRIRFDGARGALVQVDDDIAVATMADRPPVASHCGKPLLPFGGEKDARGAAESGKLTPCGSVSGGQTGVNGVLVHALGSLRPGETRDISYSIGMGNNEARALDEAQKALAGGFAARAAEDRSHWAGVLGRGKPPAALPASARPVYRRAIVTMQQHRVTNGAFIAAPTLTSPVYRFVWPRDGSKTAIDLLEAGYLPEAKQFFEFLEKVLLPDGSFAVNYFSDGSKPLFNFGVDGNENDQPGMLPWGVDHVFQVTNDRVWLGARWPAIRRVAEHMLKMSATANGLVAPSRDLWELEQGSSWTYANGSAVAGLEAAARIGNALGMTADAARYDARAKALRETMAQKLIAPGGYWARGLKGTKIDERLEIGNLALGAGGFGIYQDTDPRLARVGDLVKERLLSPGGGVKRYEGDRYYGGQPWPVAAAWLSMHAEARGDRKLAEAEFASMTRQALTTESRMLGEQFDESKKEWVSAMPLVWSEAAYVKTALTLYSR